VSRARPSRHQVREEPVHVSAGAERVLGVGLDVVEARRVQQAIENWGDRFLSRIYRGEERAYCDSQASPWRHYAGRFALKEAVAKAFGTGIGDRIGWKDIQVVRDPSSGAPGVRLHGNAARLAKQLGVERIWVSITHSHSLAIAQAILVGRGVRAASVSSGGRHMGDE